MKDVLVVGSVSDNTFVDDIAQHLRQQEDYSDLISLKSFLNREFCPRFIVDGPETERIGHRLEGKSVLIVSTSVNELSREEMAMRNFLIARAAKDNGAERVILLEPDLYYSAQDRGPRPEHGVTRSERPVEDLKKFDGQPFSARLYAELMKSAGVDEVVTVHNHSYSVMNIFKDRLNGRFHNLEPSDVYAGYIRDTDIADHNNLILCAPDKGALPFVESVHQALGDPAVQILGMAKERKGERCVCTEVAGNSCVDLGEIEGRDVIVIDDMVRTGTTIVECCRLLRTARPRRIVFMVTHFYSSQECRVHLNDPAIDEIVTTSTIPQILNRDMQGRLRHKMVVLRIPRWISHHLMLMLDPESAGLPKPLYIEDMSSKNPRYKGRLGPLFSQYYDG